MADTKKIMESGLLEMYVLGLADSEETQQVEIWAEVHPEIRQELRAIEEALEFNARINAVEPGVTVKPLLMASIDFMQRVEKGEEISDPPLLHPASKISDYEFWLTQNDKPFPEDFDGLYAKIINASPEAVTLIAWLQDTAPEEVHTKEHEHFLIVEGTCTITVENTPHNLLPGDYFAIPLYKPHDVKVTSDIPCKVILQRVAVSV